MALSSGAVGLVSPSVTPWTPVLLIDPLTLRRISQNLSVISHRSARKRGIRFQSRHFGWQSEHGVKNGRANQLVFVHGCCSPLITFGSHEGRRSIMTQTSPPIARTSSPPLVAPIRVYQPLRLRHRLEHRFNRVGLVCCALTRLQGWTNESRSAERVMQLADSSGCKERVRRDWNKRRRDKNADK